MLVITHRCFFNIVAGINQKAIQQQCIKTVILTCFNSTTTTRKLDIKTCNEGICKNFYIE